MTSSQEIVPTRFGILIVDDDPASIRQIRAGLNAYTDVRFATSGKDALRLARERAPDMLLLDAELPGEGEFELCRKFKADHALREIPIVFVTPRDDLALEQNALRAGAADFITKPISPPRLALRVGLHLKCKQLREQLRLLSSVDALTELLNRRSFDDLLAREWRRSMRNRMSLSLLLVDVDFFKRFNDTYGHAAGDECLRHVASAVRVAARRPTDRASRFGGEEFALLLGETPLEGARVVATNLLATMEHAGYPHATSDVAPHVTLSVGISSIPVQASGAEELGEAERAALYGESEHELVRAAERALYLAKQRGRNRAEYTSIDTLRETVPHHEG